jgi:hypothetical protein
MARAKSAIKKKGAKKKSAIAGARKTAAFRQNGVSTKRTANSVLNYVPWSTVELEELNPLLQRQFVVGHEIMLARVLLKKGCIVPEHSHVFRKVEEFVEPVKRRQSFRHGGKLGAEDGDKHIDQ